MAQARSRRGGNRLHNGRRRPQTTIADRPKDRQYDSVVTVSGAIADVARIGRQGANAFASAFGTPGATAVYMEDGTAVVFEHDSVDWRERFGPMLAGNPERIEVTGVARKPSRSLHNVFGVSTVIDAPRQVRFLQTDRHGEFNKGIDTVVSADPLGLVMEDYLSVKVPSTGYCIRCRKSVYRENLVRVYIDRHEGGIWDEQDIPGWANYHYTNATRGTCSECGATVVRFGTLDSETVRVVDKLARYVQPVTRVKLERPKAEVPEGALPHPAGYCMVCRAPRSTYTERVNQIAG